MFSLTVDYIIKFLKQERDAAGDTIFISYRNVTTTGEEGYFPLDAFKQHHENIFHDIINRDPQAVYRVKRIDICYHDSIFELIFQIDSNVSEEFVYTIEDEALMRKILKHHYNCEFDVYDIENSPLWLQCKDREQLILRPRQVDDQLLLLYLRHPNACLCFEQDLGPILKELKIIDVDECNYLELSYIDPSKSTYRGYTDPVSGIMFTLTDFQMSELLSKCYEQEYNPRIML